MDPAFAAGIGDERAVVILEPDALALTDCLSEADKRTRTELLRFAVETLTEREGVAVYLDAGHARWHSPDEIAARLRAVGVEKTAGFALNVSNYVADGQTVAQAWNGISTQTGASVSVRNAAYNGSLAAGASTSFGFTGTRTGANSVPTNVSCERA